MAKAKTAAQPALFLEGELPPMPGEIEQKAFDAWNAVAERAGWPKATKLSPTRMRKLKAAVKEAGGLVEWRTMLERATRSTFLTVKWRPDLEFFCQPAKIIKTQEGGFDDKGAGPDGGMSIASRSDPETEWGRRTRGYLPGGLWMTHWGPKPEQPGCQAPPAWLVPWREKHGIVVVIHQKESRADRLAHSIATHRKLGNHARANALELELATLEGKSPVLVPPHPSVKDANAPSGAKNGHSVDPRMGHNRPPGPITDVDEDSGWDMVPEGAEHEHVD